MAGWGLPDDEEAVHVDAAAEVGDRDGVRSGCQAVEHRTDLPGPLGGCVEVDRGCGAAVDGDGGRTPVRAERGEPGDVAADGEAGLVQRASGTRGGGEANSAAVGAGNGAGS